MYITEQNPFHATGLYFHTFIHSSIHPSSPCTVLTVLGQQCCAVSQCLQGQPDVPPLRAHQQQGLHDGQELH